ncbi:hypothetical protein SDC9_179722 [bioreactor metagenome]|uniref:Uncharacterized protein n=1 Tax=bioreactor metagenome TaxID=1076179 RepID=A0A645H185_9ZZZZ
MDTIDHGVGIGIIGIVEFHRVPIEVVRPPILPVLHHHINRHLQLPVLSYHIYNLLLTLIALPALDISKAPQREHGSRSGQFPVTVDYFIGIFPGYEIIINAVAGFGSQAHFMVDCTVNGG